MISLAEAIIATVAGWGAEPDEALQLERRIFGSTDPVHIGQCVETFCAHVLGSPVVDCLFWRSHMGSVSGVQLADGRQVVIKAYPASANQRSAYFFADHAHLSAAHRVQRFLVERGFPCPPPVLGPTPIEHGYAMVEEMVTRGDQVDAHDPAIRRLIAGTLARLVLLTRELGPVPDLAPRHPRGVVWPTPHHALFDFAATTAGAEWIDALARAAQQALARDPSPLVVGHLDWRTEHFRFVDGDVGVIYDWDSLSYTTEAAVVGVAAATFTATWDIPVLVSPTPEETDAFIAEYEVARGRCFTPAEQEALLAQVTYTRAYSARAEHSRDPSATHFPTGSLRAGLRLHRDAMLQRQSGRPAHRSKDEAGAMPASS
jgi:hypothetical protein